MAARKFITDELGKLSVIEDDDIIIVSANNVKTTTISFANFYNSLQTKIVTDRAVSNDSAISDVFVNSTKLKKSKELRFVPGINTNIEITQNNSIKINSYALADPGQPGLVYRTNAFETKVKQILGGSGISVLDTDDFFIITATSSIISENSLLTSRVNSNGVTLVDLKESVDIEPNTLVTRDSFGDIYARRIYADEIVGDNSIQFANESGVTQKFKTPVTINLTGDVSGSVTFDGSLQNVTLNTTTSNSPDADVVASIMRASSVVIDEAFNIDTYTVESNQNEELTVLDSFPTSMYRTVKYLVQISTFDNLEFFSTEILLTHNNINPVFTEYATVTTSDKIFDFTAVIENGVVSFSVFKQIDEIINIRVIRQNILTI